MGYIKKIKRKNGNNISYDYYLYENIRRDGKRIQKLIRSATPEEIAASDICKNNRKDIALMTCANPDCDKQIKIPRSQKRRFNTTYPKRYNRFQMVYCSEECQQVHDKVLRGD